MSKSKYSVDLDTLKKFSLFNGFTDQELEMIAALVKIRKCRKGEIIVEEGEPGDETYILLEGEMEVTQKLTLFASETRDLDKRDKMLIRLKADFHPFVGEMSLFQENMKRSASMAAIGEVKLGAINNRELLKLAQENKNIGFNLFYNIGLVLAARLKKANQDIMKLTTAFSLALENG